MNEKKQQNPISEYEGSMLSKVWLHKLNPNWAMLAVGIC